MDNENPSITSSTSEMVEASGVSAAARRNRDVVILVPTTNRPQFLRTALASIATQTAVRRIHQVIVSENASGDDSAGIAAEFANTLPIRFVAQKPALPALDHFHWLADQLPSSGYAAILHDDDWWTEQHLATGLSHIDERTGCNAFFGAHFSVTSESAPVVADWGFRMWFGAGYPNIANVWRLSPSSLLLACVLGTPAHYSGMIAAASAFRSAVHRAVATGNPFDNDRDVIMELARIGNASYAPIPTVFARMHPGQDFRRQQRGGDHLMHVAATTGRLIALAKELGIDLANEIEERFRRCPAPHSDSLLWLLARPELGGELQDHGLLPEIVVASLARRARNSSWWRRMAGRLLLSVTNR